MGWPNKTPLLTQYYPTSLLVTGFDIIFFWVSRMIFSSLYFLDQVPFEKVYFHGLIRDKQGRKMSKSLNNTIDPLTIIDDFGCDALRFTLASLSSSSGQDINMDLTKVSSSRNFMNKIWNAGNFVLDNSTENDGKNELSAKICISIWDFWLVSRFNHVIAEIRSSLENYHFNEACQKAYSFVWDDYCDWYIEMTKQSPNPVLLRTMYKTILKMIHPFAPFITESIWQMTGNNQAKSILLTSYPEETDRENPLFFESSKQVEILQDVIRGIRNLKSEFNLSAPLGLQIYIMVSDSFKRQVIKDNLSSIEKLSRVEKIHLSQEGTEKGIHLQLDSTLKLILPLSEDINIEKEIHLKQKRLVKLEEEIQKLAKKLASPDFINHAPTDVVKEVKTEYEELETQRSLIEKRILDLHDLTK